MRDNAALGGHRVAGGAASMIWQGSGAEGSCTMADSLNPAAPHHLPIFIPAPGNTDVLMVVTAIILVLCVVGFGVLFLRDRKSTRLNSSHSSISYAVFCLKKKNKKKKNHYRVRDQQPRKPQ